jgi:serine-protein kinase ATM
MQVPFRLTRDLIDGMGVTGVEGVFRRCCEETLSVMRTNKEALLTIIEVNFIQFFSFIYFFAVVCFLTVSNLKILQVFIHDPLYKWALSPLKALQRQKVC